MASQSNEYITKFYKCLDTNEKHHILEQKLDQLRGIDSRLLDLREEFCFYVASSEPLSSEERRQISWLIEPSFSDDYVTVSDTKSHLRSALDDQEQLSGLRNGSIVEVGPRLNFCSPFSTNAVSILRSSCERTSVYRLERSTIYQMIFKVPTLTAASQQFDVDEAARKLVARLYDEMVETIYETPVNSFHPEAPRAKVASGEDWLQPSAEVDIIGRGERALREISTKLGLFFDDWDINYYVGLFRDTIGRNPTVVECFDLAQSNSEHSRHWFFKGILEVENRRPSSRSLIDMVASTQISSNKNNIIKFEDNSSAIRGFERLTLLRPRSVDRCAPIDVVREPARSEAGLASDATTRHIIFTAETHNFPTGVAPFPGAATGTGGRIRDVQATGRGAHVIAGTAGYSFGNLFLEDYELDWENPHEMYPRNLALPCRVAIEASNGASDYGNKFGEPIVAGFARSFGQRLVSRASNSSERWEYLKPIMFTGGLGTIDDEYVQKEKPEPGMNVAKIGGPVYRIGIGGGAASSAPGNEAEPDDERPEKKEAKEEQQRRSNQLNFNAVQRGDPEMEQKLNRVIRACIENRAQAVNDKADSGYNPILSIHDQGAGGNGNVLKEIVDPLGATIDANEFTLGDHTVNVLELWAAEYQESDAILAHPARQSRELLERISRREKCKIDTVGQVEASGAIRLKNFRDSDSNSEKQFPIDLKLEHVIGSMPRKVFKLQDYKKRSAEFLAPAKLIELDWTPMGQVSSAQQQALMVQQLDKFMGHQQQHSQMMRNFEQLLKKVLRLASVASKRYLTTKVDRCVTGLIAGQQCLGPLHTPIGDYALVALSHFDHRGAVTSIGEQPIKGLVSPVANATMSVAEALTNMMFCVISSLRDVKCSANWMWAAKLPGEGAKLLDACEAMCSLMERLGIAVDGGKDSLSMSASVDPTNARAATDQLGSEPGDDFEQDDSVEVVKSPGTLVISAYAPVPDIRLKVTPILRCKPKRSHLIYVNLAHPADDSGEPTGPAESVECKAETCESKPDGPSEPRSAERASTSNKFRLGGSALLQTLGQIGDEAPNIDHPELLRDGFELVQELIREGVCTAGHDVSDGGLIVCALEMALASHCGLHLNICAERAFSDLGCANNDERILATLFAEECAVVIEVEAESEHELGQVLARFAQRKIQAQRIGFGSYENQRVTVKFEQQLLLDHETNGKLRDSWEGTSKHLDLLQASRRCVNEEYDNLNGRLAWPNWRLTFDPNATKLADFKRLETATKQEQRPKVAVLREEGINGDREMVASLAMAGFQVFDLTVTDLVGANGLPKVDLNGFQGLVFPGGFSYADVFGSGRGWAATLIFNHQIRQQLIKFRRRTDTFSLGVCNGCQLMSLLGFLDDLPDKRSNKLIPEIPETSVRLEQNDSGRFECRFVNVRIETTTNSIMLRDMEESVFGVWVAHGEGKFKVHQSVEVDSDSRVALRYVDDKGQPTQEYPFNPNGSSEAVAGMCSRDGRHLAVMPHPERCTQMWQWPYAPPDWVTPKGEPVATSPWMQMFVNAYEFCLSSSVGHQ